MISNISQLAEEVSYQTAVRDFRKAADLLRNIPTQQLSSEQAATTISYVYCDLLSEIAVTVYCATHAHSLMDTPDAYTPSQCRTVFEHKSFTLLAQSGAASSEILTLFEDFYNSGKSSTPESQVLAKSIVGDKHTAVISFFDDLIAAVERGHYAELPKYIDQSDRSEAVLYTVRRLCDRASDCNCSTPETRSVCTKYSRYALRCIMEYSCACAGTTMDQCTDPVTMLDRLPKEQAIIDGRCFTDMLKSIQAIEACKGTYADTEHLPESLLQPSAVLGKILRSFTKLTHDGHVELLVRTSKSLGKLNLS